MESLLYPYESPTVPYPKPDESIPRHYIVFKIQFHIHVPSTPRSPK
jgi:hypothetical protein